MISVIFRVQFFPDDGGDHWRVFSGDGSYYSAMNIDDVPNAIRQMLEKEAADLTRLSTSTKIGQKP